VTHAREHPQPVLKRVVVRARHIAHTMAVAPLLARSGGGAVSAKMQRSGLPGFYSNFVWSVADEWGGCLIHCARAYMRIMAMRTDMRAHAYVKFVRRAGCTLGSTGYHSSHPSWPL
jgi:hypothetical protein